jgi:murein DD-endopeptidase MepM/ murein hydrolase activator NlpD
LLIALGGSSCNSTIHKILDVFDNKTPHEQYAEKLEDKHLDDTPEGRQWVAASKKALEAPQTVQLPYRQNGYFHTDKPRALGLEFQAKYGERITFNLTKKGGEQFVIYADLFKQGGGTPAHLLSADTTKAEFSFDVDETGTYILRLQPELYRTGEYSLSVSEGPSLGFPVAYAKANIGSFWGDNRDAGKRKHEGVDIFAPKLTPAVAAADGNITGVREGGIGGKTVWLKPNDKNVYLYYAHLDKQLVQEGQSVKKGDVVGLVGNTGNAKFTPSHLHFGVYTISGAVNPLPFVNRTVKTAPAVPTRSLTGILKVIKAQKLEDGTLVKAATELVPLAVTAKGYIAELPDGNLIQTPFAAVKAVPLPSVKSSTEGVVKATSGASKGA